MEETQYTELNNEHFSSSILEYTRCCEIPKHNQPPIGLRQFGDGIQEVANDGVEEVDKVV